MCLVQKGSIMTQKSTSASHFLISQTAIMIKIKDPHITANYVKPWTVVWLQGLQRKKWKKGDVFVRHDEAFLNSFDQTGD